LIGSRRPQIVLVAPLGLEHAVVCFVEGHVEQLLGNKVARSGISRILEIVKNAILEPL
jgi:hypothetical protein